MMTDLEAFRDHARDMASRTRSRATRSRPEVSVADRALWKQLADEIDAYLSPADDGQGDLF